MKKTFPININGRVFYIDEDAYELLKTYIEQLHKSFPGEEGKEIIADIETRISEIFSEKAGDGNSVIVLADVSAVIAQMGQPDEILNEQAETADASEPSAGPTPPPFPSTKTVKKLYRSENDKVLGGVLGGLGVYLNWNANIMRLFIVMLALTGIGSVLAIIYLVAWMIIPLALSERQKLEMTGTPVTVETVGQSFLGTAHQNEISHNELNFTNVMSILGKIILGLLGILGICIGFAMIAILIQAISGAILYIGWDNYNILRYLGGSDGTNNPIMTAVAFICLALSVTIPCIAVAWVGCCTLFKSKPASRTTIVSALILEVVLIITTIVLFNLAHIRF